MPMIDYTCPNGHRFESLTKLNPEHFGTLGDGPVKGKKAEPISAPFIRPCPECGADSPSDSVPASRHLGKLGPDANFNSVRFNFDW